VSRALKSVRALHRAVKNAQYDNDITIKSVRDDVRKPGNQQLACAFHASWSPDAGMLCEHGDMTDDLKDCIDCGAEVIAADVFLDKVKVAVSGPSPL
jgi:hypothetical protein